jgi:hypothetical protein
MLMNHLLFTSVSLIVRSNRDLDKRREPFTKIWLSRHIRSSLPSRKRTTIGVTMKYMCSRYIIEVGEKSARLLCSLSSVPNLCLWFKRESLLFCWIDELSCFKSPVNTPYRSHHQFVKEKPTSYSLRQSYATHKNTSLLKQQTRHESVISMFCSKTTRHFNVL